MFEEHSKKQSYNLNINAVKGLNRSNKDEYKQSVILTIDFGDRGKDQETRDNGTCTMDHVDQEHRIRFES